MIFFRAISVRFSHNVLSLFHSLATRLYNSSCRSVRLSVGPSVSVSFLGTLFYHSPCPPARDFGSRVSGRVLASLWSVISIDISFIPVILTRLNVIKSHIKVRVEFASSGRIERNHVRITYLYRHRRLETRLRRPIHSPERLRRPSRKANRRLASCRVCARDAAVGRSHETHARFYDCPASSASSSWRMRPPPRRLHKGAGGNREHKHHG